jgi:hypothetical protein
MQYAWDKRSTVHMKFGRKARRKETNRETRHKWEDNTGII